MKPQDEPNDRAALFAAGAIASAGGADSDALLAEAIAAGFGPTVAELASAIPPVEPPPGAKARLLASLPPQQREAAAGLRFRFAGDGGFVPTPFPGVSVRVLHLDRSRRQFTALLKLEPGAAYPPHAHDGPEECLVLSGELLVGDVRMKEGDYQRAEAGSAHVEQRTETGALLYLTAPFGLLRMGAE